MESPSFFFNFNPVWVFIVEFPDEFLLVANNLRATSGHIDQLTFPPCSSYFLKGHFQSLASGTLFPVSFSIWSSVLLDQVGLEMCIYMVNHFDVRSLERSLQCYFWFRVWVKIHELERLYQMQICLMISTTEDKQ